MATIDLALLLGANMHATVMNERMPFHYAEYLLNFATAVTTKGSALAAADVIEVLDIPKQSIIMAAGYEVITAVAGAALSVLTIDVGVTGVDADVFVDGHDLYAAVAGDYAAQPAAYFPIVIGNTADTLDVLIASQTGALSTGVIRVWVFYGDVRDYVTPAIAALGS